MNTDLITKLAKLANNNPNENEANLAARKVCKLLAEGNFQFNGIRTASDKIPDARNQRTWDDVQRSTEAEWNSRPNTSPFNDFFRQYYEDQSEWWYQREPKSTEDYIKWDGIPKSKAKDDNHYYQYTKPSEQKEERLLKCKTCGNSKLTKFVGLAELYECNNCQWAAYKREKK